jgi:hypothetical protein
MSNDTEPRYTLAEAKAELSKRECSQLGHDLVVWEREPTLGRRDFPPLGVQCVRCEQIWRVEE